MINYIVFPKSDLDETREAKMNELHLIPRKSKDSTKIIIKDVHYNEIFSDKVDIEVRMINEEEVETKSYPYPTYSGSALDELLSSPEWSWTEEEMNNSSDVSASATPVEG